MTTKQTCTNCTHSQWTSVALMCTNKESDEYLMFVLGLDTCNEFDESVDDTDLAGALE